MEKFEYGPVEIYVVEFAGEAVDPGVLRSVADLSEGSVVRLLDMVVATRALDGSTSIVEIADASGEALDIQLAVQGLLGEEDVAEALALVQPGSGVALVALELRWATELAQNLAAANGTVIHSQRIPAAVVNNLISETIASDA